MIDMHEQVQKYLSRVLPEVGEDSYINVHWSFKGREDKKFWTGRATKSIPDAISAVAFALKGADTLDIYACMSLQREAEKVQSARGFPYLKAVRNQNNVVSLKSLFLDIDYFKGGMAGYESPAEATKALAEFLQHTSMPKPSLMVQSGGGLHVYWTLDRALSRDEWEPLAFALAEATKKHGLKCDTQCTIDSARILRIPGTFNRKQKPGRPVKLVAPEARVEYKVEELDALLAPYKTIVPRRNENGSMPISDLAAGIINEHPPIDAKGVIPECGFIATAVTTGGKDYTNPLWNLTTLAATFMQNSRLMAHLMARKHPGYTRESTDELFDRKEREKSEKGLGWPSCATISASGCTACQTCPHLSKGKSPFHHSRAVPPKAQAQQLALLPAQPGITNNSDLPKGYTRTPNGIVCKRVTLEDGTSSDVPISAFPMTRPWLQRDPWALSWMTVTDRPQVITIPTECIGTNEMRKKLQEQGFMLHDTEGKGIGDFLVSWVKQLRETKDAVVSTEPFGWQVERGKLQGFVFGGSLWTPNGTRIAPSPDPVTANQYTPQGNISPWWDAAHLITNQKRPALDAILASAFAAPLVRFTGESGLLMSTYSKESGIGKSTATKVAQAVWGDPIRGRQSLTDTSNSVINKIGEMRSLPLYWDELKTEEDTRRFVTMVFQLSQGKEKSRLQANAKQRQTGTWQTLMVSASNESLLDYVTQRTRMTTAGLMRVFEFTIEPGTQGQLSVSDANRVISRLNDNYGHAGLAYATFLGNEFARIDKEVGAFFKELEVEVQAKVEERFWISLITVICMGARYANELKMTQIDEAALKAFMITSLGKMRAERNDQPVDMADQFNVANILSQFLNSSRARHTLVTNRIIIGPGKPQPGAIKMLNDTTKIDGLYVHIGRDDKLLRVSSTYLSEWLQEKGLSRHMFMEALKDKFAMKQLRGRLGGGTPLSNMTEYLLEIDLAGSPHNFLDDLGGTP